MILLWAVASGQLVHVLRCTSDVKHSTVSVAFNQDTTLLASCISDHTKGNRGTIEIWEVASGRLCQVLVRAGYIRSVTFSPNGIFLASNIEETVQLWEVASGQLVHVLQGGRSIPLSSAQMGPSWPAEIAMGMSGSGRLDRVR
jgi:WD40 repeat protein